jgi:hypothetical protein
MKPQPFHSTAMNPIEHIPASQDAETYHRNKTREIRRSEQAYARDEQRIRRELNAAEPGSDAEAVAKNELVEVDDARKGLREQERLMARNIRFINEKYPIPQVFLIAIPTSVEREQINSRLVALGLSQVTQEQIRATMIEELFHQDWSEPGQEPLTEEQNLTKAEDHANFLDGCWLRQMAHDTAIKEWQEQEVERLIDEAEGAPARLRAELPPKIITVREQSRMQLLVDRMMSTSQKLRDLAAANMDFARQNAVLLMRMHLVGVKGFEPKLPLDRDPRTNTVPEEAILSLREQVDDASWGDVVTYIDRLYVVSEDEEKNSDSLPGKLSPLDGSIEPSDDQDSSGGNSKGSTSTPLPGGASETTTATSSASTSDSATAPEQAAQSDSPTGDR